MGDNDGTVNGATTGVSGITGQAISFDGSNDYVQADGSLNGGSTFSSVTLSALAKPDVATSSLRGILRVGDDGNMVIRANSNSKWNVFISDSGGANTQISGGTVEKDKWKHIVGVWDGSEVRLYVNSTQVASASQSSIETNVKSNSFVGSTDGVPNQPWDGTIDDPRIYNRALSSEEISNLYNSYNI